MKIVLIQEILPNPHFRKRGERVIIILQTLTWWKQSQNFRPESVISELLLPYYKTALSHLSVPLQLCIEWNVTWTCTFPAISSHEETISWRFGPIAIGFDSMQDMPCPITIDNMTYRNLYTMMNKNIPIIGQMSMYGRQKSSFSTNISDIVTNAVSLCSVYNQCLDCLQY